MPPLTVFEASAVPVHHLEIGNRKSNRETGWGDSETARLGLDAGVRANRLMSVSPFRPGKAVTKEWKLRCLGGTRGVLTFAFAQTSR